MTFGLDVMTMFCF